MLQHWRFIFWTFVITLLVVPAHAAIFYVNVSNTAPVAPYSSWPTAATNIQNAIDAANAGDTVLVTNGVYATGGRVEVANGTTNRVTLDKAVTVQSVNGPWATIIQGAGMTNGSSAVRCVWLTNGATLTGFTLRYGATGGADYFGGAAACTSNAVVANCLIYSNTAAGPGAVIYQGNFRNCAVYASGSQTMYATYACALDNCTVVNNNTESFAVNGGTMTNCIIYNNSYEGNYGNTTRGNISYCCTYPLPLGGTGNFTNLPGLFVDDLHLTPGSPCIGAGANVAMGTDLFGQPWNNPPSIGCCEWQPAPLVGQPVLTLTNNPSGFTINIPLIGNDPLICWWLQNGIQLQDNSHFSGTQTTNLFASNVLYTDAGSYQLIASNSFGVTTSAVAQVVIHCADANGTNPAAPYLTWNTAATNLQDAENIALPGEIILATNGIYSFGGKSIDGIITNRVAIDKAVLVQSVNGPTASFIQGSWNPIITNGSAAIRCAWLTNGAGLSGFTLRGGATQPVTVSSNHSADGGGVWGASINAVVFNCIITNCLASDVGGGANQATLNNCILTDNQAVGSNTPGAGIGNAGSGGGACGCHLNNCLIIGNAADQTYGGGTYNCILKNCALVQNSSYLYGGGAYEGELVSCTVSGNTSGGYGAFGGAVASATLTDCIVMGNYLRPGGSTSTNWYSCTFAYSDTDPLPSGPGNIDANPQLLTDDIHLNATSPCIGLGINVMTGTDIDGQPWNNPPSMGCDEWYAQPVIALQPTLQPILTHALSLSAVVAGESPYSYTWFKDGSPVQNGGHYSFATTSNLIVNAFDLSDAGLYQVVVSNAFGVITSQVAQVVIHCVNASGNDPVSPYSTWATAATNIQDAIDAASPGDIVLVTNGVYAFGGHAWKGGTTNRVLISEPITVLSVNGYANTIIQGAWDPNTTNGPLAVRCCFLATNTRLTGFTLYGWATMATSDNLGGGVCTAVASSLATQSGIISVNSTIPGIGIINNCWITGNEAPYGGGICGAGVINSLISSNSASTEGGGAYYGALTNCTVVNNTASSWGGGGGVYNGTYVNSIINDNNLNPPSSSSYVNYSYNTILQYCCTAPLLYVSNTNNIAVDPQFVDPQYHLAATSPCIGQGYAPATSGLDLDGETWANPPAIGAYEVHASDFTGPMTIAIIATVTNIIPGRPWFFTSQVTGRPARLCWSWGDGTMITNGDYVTGHTWTSSGNFTVTATAYNNDYPAGVSTNLLVYVEPLPVLQYDPAANSTNGIGFMLTTPAAAFVTVQTATNLTPPVNWTTWQMLFPTTTNQAIVIPTANGAQFFRVEVQ